VTALDGTIGPTTSLVDHGSPTQRFNLVLVSEGYRDVELDQFAKDAQDFVDTFLATTPFDAFKEAFNIYRIDVSSTDSGADKTGACYRADEVVERATYFDAHFCALPPRTDTLDVNVPLVKAVVGATVPAWHAILVIVNSPNGGGGGHMIDGVGAYTNRPATATRPPWELFALHELGHAAFGLNDEYSGLKTPFPGAEPSSANVTKTADAAKIKWSALVTAGAAMPTMPYGDCTKSNAGPSPFPTYAVGAFEGAAAYNCEVYRGQYTCIMKEIPGSFCVVCQRRIEETLAPHLPNRFIRPLMRSKFGHWRSLVPRPPLPHR
jgi:hypothetical protein